MTTVLAVVHHQRTEAPALLRSIGAWLDQRGHKLVLLDEDAQALNLSEYATAMPDLVANVALSLGGDGTMLRTVGRVAAQRTPIIGVNLGQLGYLTQVEPSGVFDALQGFFAGEAVIEDRMMLAIEHRRGAQVTLALALNELVIEKSEPGHTVRMRVAIDGEDFTSYAADALIVATPTGSTAYSLSVRGPIVSPSHRAMVLSPVAPHMLFDRSLVLGPEQRLDIALVGHRLAEMTIDGIPMISLEPDDVITCTASDITARFVRNGALPFHQILKAKFGLADR